VSRSPSAAPSVTNNLCRPDSATRTDMDPQTDGIVSGVSQISTSDLPDGVPENQLRDAKDHKIGHLQSTKHTIDS
jgi:hypothetical protein